MVLDAMAASRATPTVTSRHVTTGIVAFPLFNFSVFKFIKIILLQ